MDNKMEEFGEVSAIYDVRYMDGSYFLKHYACE